MNCIGFFLMNARPYLFFIAASALFLFGCLSAPSSNSTNHTGLNATVPNASATVQGPRVASAALCRVVSSGQSELFLVDATRYAYELQTENGTSLEILYVNDTLYLHGASPSVPECSWIAFNQDDLAFVDQIGGIRLLTHAELASRLSADSCQTVPLMEQVFTLPTNACPFRDVILRSQAG